jgi:hypothetical protein
VSEGVPGVHTGGPVAGTPSLTLGVLSARIG